MATLPDGLLLDAAVDVGEFAGQLHQLGLRLLDADSDDAQTALRIAHGLYEVQKSLSDGRQIRYDDASGQR